MTATVTPIRRRPEPRFVPCVEAAKMLRAMLKREFPGTKFRVRSDRYAFGASIQMLWIDGPAEVRVKAVAKRFSGSDFDGMIDLRVSREHWLCPDGSVHFAGTRGTEGSKGTIPFEQHPAPCAGAELVHFGCDHVSVNRRHSQLLLEKVARAVAARCGAQVPQVVDTPHGAHVLDASIELENLIRSAAAETGA